MKFNRLRRAANMRGCRGGRAGLLTSVASSELVVTLPPDVSLTCSATPELMRGITLLRTRSTRFCTSGG